MRNIIPISRNNSFAWLGFVLFLCLGFGACRKDRSKPDYPAGSNEYINSWILDSMKVYYYWNKTLPTKPNIGLAPADFFSSILNQSDRFSRLINPAVPESYYPSLVHNFGFDLAIYQQNGGAAKTVLTLVVPQSQASLKNLQRGDVIKSVNGTIPSAVNMAGLILVAIKQRKLTLEVEGKGSIEVGASIVAENPVYLYKIFNAGGKTIGYLFYNAFEGRSKYQLQEAFNFFKAQQATELIIDLRYNPGGDIGMSAALGAAIANVNAGDVFVAYQGNANAGTIKENFGQAIGKIAAGYSFSFDEMKAMRLSLSRVFVLTGNHTASAAEFLVKGLRPWINVTQIGATTLGKDMASFTIEDNNAAKNNKWQIEPMIFKLYNSRGEGNYSTGLVPDQQVDEFGESLLPFGDANDPLIRYALAIVAGTIKKTAVQGQQVSVLFDSRDMIDQAARPTRITRNKN